MYGTMKNVPNHQPELYPNVSRIFKNPMNIPATFAKQLPSQAMTSLVESSLPNPQVLNLGEGNMCFRNERVQWIYI